MYNICFNLFSYFHLLDLIKSTTKVYIIFPLLSCRKTKGCFSCETLFDWRKTKCKRKLDSSPMIISHQSSSACSLFSCTPKLSGNVCILHDIQRPHHPSHPKLPPQRSKKLQNGFSLRRDDTRMNAWGRGTRSCARRVWWCFSSCEWMGFGRFVVWQGDLVTVGHWRSPIDGARTWSTRSP